MYEGSWKDNKQHGKGTYTDQNGKSQSGIWNDGERKKEID